MKEKNNLRKKPEIGKTESNEEIEEVSMPRKGTTDPCSNESYIKDNLLCEEVPLGIVG